MLRISKEFIKTKVFEADGLIFLSNIKEVYRPRSDMKLPPSVDEQMKNLRKRFASIFATKYKNFAQLEVRCGISESIMRKYLKGTRKITRETVAKICIGTPLTIEESEELFTLQGHSLEPDKQRFDALVVNAIQDKDDIGIFIETCKEYGIDLF